MCLGKEKKKKTSLLKLWVIWRCFLFSSGNFLLFHSYLQPALCQLLPSVSHILSQPCHCTQHWLQSWCGGAMESKYPQNQEFGGHWMDTMPMSLIANPHICFFFSRDNTAKKQNLFKAKLPSKGTYVLHWILPSCSVSQTLVQSPLDTEEKCSGVEAFPSKARSIPYSHGPCSATSEDQLECVTIYRPWKPKPERGMCGGGKKWCSARPYNSPWQDVAMVRIYHRWWSSHTDRTWGLCIWEAS